MCYFLYGSINDGINTDDYEKAFLHSNYRFNIGSKNDVNKCVEACSSEYRITLSHCDCENPIGKNEADSSELGEIATLLHSLTDIRGIKHIYLSRNWYGEINKTEQTVHIDDIDVKAFLANVQDNCLYKIELFKKYF